MRLFRTFGSKLAEEYSNWKKLWWLSKSNKAIMRFGTL